MPEEWICTQEETMDAITLKIGDAAPNFDLMSDTGKRIKLSDYRGKRVVVFFYPQDDTPGCTTQACGFRDRYLEIEENNAVVLGISPDDLESHRKFKTKHNLPFLLLVDAEHKVAEAYGVWGQKTAVGVTVPKNTRSHFVVDETGKIADAQVKVSPTDSVERALASVVAK
jgi:thioredoxin-dependent peroxiredoxin